MAEKKETAKKASSTKAAAKKAPAKKAAGSSAKAAAKKTTSSAKKAPAKKTAASTTAAATKATAKTSAAKKAPAKKAAGSSAKAAAKKTTSSAKKAPAKKTAASTKPAQPAEKVSTLRVHHLRPAPGSHMPKVRVGRGEGGRRGKTAGRGTKGTGARYQVPVRFEGGQTPIHMRIPKMRGFKNPFRTEYQVVNVETIAQLFPKGGKITKADLVDKGAVRKNELVKVLGNGDISVKVELVDADKVSRSAKSKIEAAGGSVNEG